MNVSIGEFLRLNFSSELFPNELNIIVSYSGNNDFKILVDKYLAVPSRNHYWSDNKTY